MNKKNVAKKEKNETKEVQEAGALNFATETREELAKVVWPSRQQLISESIAVMLMVALVATVIYLVDNFFVWLSGRVFG